MVVVGGGGFFLSACSLHVHRRLGRDFDHRTRVAWNKCICLDASIAGRGLTTIPSGLSAARLSWPFVFDCYGSKYIIFPLLPRRISLVPLHLFCVSCPVFINEVRVYIYILILLFGFIRCHRSMPLHTPNPVLYPPEHAVGGRARSVVMPSLNDQVFHQARWKLGLSRSVVCGSSRFGSRWTRASSLESTPPCLCPEFTLFFRPLHGGGGRQDPPT